MRTHYPRTPHLPWSPGASSDDVRVPDLAGLRDREVVVTEKLDGENTTLYRDGSHARSLDSAHHSSRAWVKALQGRIGGSIPEGWRVCGENLYARHALPYDDLSGYFYGFSVWDGDDVCLDWDATVRFLRGVGVPTPRVLWRGVFDERALRGLRVDTAVREGYVVRTVAGFPRAEFGARVAKWVRTGHVQESATHWMFAEVVPNGLGAAAALWTARSGGEVTAEALAEAVGTVLDADADVEADGDADADPHAEQGASVPRPSSATASRVADAAAFLDQVGRTGDARLAGLLAALFADRPRAAVAAALAAHPEVGMPLARRVADLVGRAPRLHQPYPDDERRAGLVRMAYGADLAVLHAVAAATARDTAAREQVEWSQLCAEDAGLLGPDPLAGLRSELRAAFADLDPDAADRCWAEAAELVAAGRAGSAAEAVAATWRWRDGGFPRLVLLVGPSGSGKSTFAARFPASGADVVALDELRAARGSRADQRHNGEVLGEGLRRVDAALAAGRSVLWDATSLLPRQRSLVLSAARRRDALTTSVVFLLPHDEVRRRNAARAHAVPDDVLTAQLRRYAPPYPGETHRVRYVGGGGVIEDRAGGIADDCDTTAPAHVPGFAGLRRRP